MKGNVKMTLNINIGLMKHRCRVDVPGEYISRFAQVHPGTEKESFDEVKKIFAKEIEDTVNSFIREAYRSTDAPDRILARAVVLLATELALVEEALKEEGGEIPWR